MPHTTSSSNPSRLCQLKEKIDRNEDVSQKVLVNFEIVGKSEGHGGVISSLMMPVMLRT